MPYEALLEVLDELFVSYTSLLEIAEEKQGVIIKNDIGSLNRLVQRENKLIKLAAAQEAERVLRTKALFKHLGISTYSRSTLADTIRLVSGAEEKVALTRRRERLSSLLDQLRKRNEHNQQLLEQAIRFVNYSLDLLTVDPMDGMIYRPSEQVPSMRGNGYFDTRA